MIYEIETKVIINAAGPWADQVLAGTDAERHERLIGGTKGSHLVVDWPGAPKQAIFASAKSDGRPFFILPWYGMTLIGTTDIRYDGDPSDARCTPEELQYLLDEATRLFPGTPLQREHVHYTYSGVRPLPYTPDADRGREQHLPQPLRHRPREARRPQRPAVDRRRQTNHLPLPRPHHHPRHQETLPAKRRARRPGIQQPPPAVRPRHATTHL